MKLETEVYLNVAKELARLSKDKNTKVGCVILDKDGIVVSTGRNGPISKIDDNKIPHSRENEKLIFMDGEDQKVIECNKYPFYLHSEANSLLFCEDRKRLVSSTVYVTGIPCSNCSLLLAQCKVSKVIIPEDGGSIKMMDENASNISKYIFLRAGIRLFKGDTEIILDDIM